MNSYQKHLHTISGINDKKQRKIFLKNVDNDFLDYLTNILLRKIPAARFSPDDQRLLRKYQDIVKMIRDDIFTMEMKRYIILYCTHPFIHIAIKPYMKPYKESEISKPVRHRRDCPIPDCNTLGLKQLSNHLSSVHPELSVSDRRYWLSKARLQKKETISSLSHLSQNSHVGNTLCH